jgi:hypothetical protein
VLHVNERKRIHSPVPQISRADLERISSKRLLEAGPSVPLIVHDVFVAETASKIETLSDSMRTVARDIDVLTSKLATLQDRADQQHRWYGFAKSAQQVREAKLEECLRHCRDLKGRIDKMDARSGGNFHAYNSFEAVSRKIAELDRCREDAQRVERAALGRTWLFCAAVVLSALIVVSSYAMPG